MDMTLKPLNGFILVTRETKTIINNTFIVEDEAKGEGIIVKCVVTATPEDQKFLLGKTIFVPQYALRTIDDDVIACAYTSIVAYAE